MDGEPAGFDLSSIAAAADAMGLDWNEWTLKRLMILGEAWLADIHRRYTEEREKHKRELKRK